MTTTNSLRLRSQDNPGCKELPLPLWLLHELLQPINAYGLAREYLTDSLQPTLLANPELNQYWEVMGNAMRTQERLLRSFRQFVNLRTGRSPLNFRGVALRTIAQELKALYATESNSLGKSLQFDGLDKFTLFTDPDRLLELLACLVDNAIVHAKTRVEVVAFAAPEGVRIDVVDDGNGLEPAIGKFLGSPFLGHALRQPIKRAGLGLGLYIATRNAELLDATFEVSSTPGKGCRFSVTASNVVVSFPQELSISRPDPIEGIHVLIVDEDNQHAHELQKLFSSWKCHPECAPELTASRFQLASLGFYDAILVSHAVWSKHFADFDLLKAGKTTNPPNIFVIVDRAVSALDAAIPTPPGAALHILHRPLSPSRLRAVFGSALRLRRSDSLPE